MDSILSKARPRNVRDRGLRHSPRTDTDRVANWLSELGSDNYRVHASLCSAKKNTTAYLASHVSATKIHSVATRTRRRNPSEKGSLTICANVVIRHYIKRPRLLGTWPSSRRLGSATQTPVTVVCGHDEDLSHFTPSVGETNHSRLRPGEKERETELDHWPCDVTTRLLPSPPTGSK